MLRFYRVHVVKPITDSAHYSLPRKKKYPWNHRKLTGAKNTGSQETHFRYVMMSWNSFCIFLLTIIALFCYSPIWTVVKTRSLIAGIKQHIYWTTLEKICYLIYWLLRKSDYLKRAKSGRKSVVKELITGSLSLPFSIFTVPPPPPFASSSLSESLEHAPLLRQEFSLDTR